MKESRVWISSDIAKDLGLTDSPFPAKIMELKDLLYIFFRDAQPRDILVIPFMREYTKILEHMKDRGLFGPVIIYSQGDVFMMNAMDLARQGVVFIDPQRFPRPMILGFITFLQRTQSRHDTEEPLEQETRPFKPTTKDPDEIRKVFKEVMRKRLRVYISCQFRDDLPTLTATCEIIEMAGEVETRLVLDKFNPKEFVGLYTTKGNKKPLSGYASIGEANLGFTLNMIHSVGGRISVYLPSSIYEQKRKSFRVEPDPKEPITLYIKPAHGPTQNSSIRDISEGGIGLSMAYSNLEKGKTYSIALKLPRTELILGDAKIAFKNADQEMHVNYGMSIDFHASDLRYIRTYIFKRQAGILASIRDLSI
ncbi:MAG: hypothetical protein DRG37_06210 [Deltaproteobacteria bacterium]|nr:MAG: hypothetical protein DRG37_06210 [Deltaproteobacteria bacterium]